MIKYAEYYITTKKHRKAEANNGIPIFEYSWYIRNKTGEELQSSLANEPDFQYYESRDVAIQEAKDAIKDYY